MNLPEAIARIDIHHVTSMNISSKSIHQFACFPPENEYHNSFRPYYNQCHYCHIKYDVIGHLEDYLDDMMYIAIKLNITTLMTELAKPNRKSKFKDNLNRIEDHLSKLTLMQRKKLFQLYKLDFELFGYEPGIALCKDGACI